MDNKISSTLTRLSKSKFRNSFNLKDKDIEYIKNKGLDIIESHTYDFINKRLSNAIIDNDGKQTPYRGHPTFIAQHATATCCRSCLYKWHNIKPNKNLTEDEKNYIVSLIMAWINKQLKKTFP